MDAKRRATEPVRVTLGGILINPAAMEYNAPYPFQLPGWGLMIARRRGDEVIDVFKAEADEKPCYGTETVVVDCRDNSGFLGEGVRCRIDREPRCHFHTYQYGPEYTAEGRGG